jgi:hypothetical protein
VFRTLDEVADQRVKAVIAANEAGSAIVAQGRSSDNDRHLDTLARLAGAKPAVATRAGSL